jgi:hypothetical protein
MDILLHVCHRYEKLHNDTGIGEIAKGENACEVQDAVEVQITLQSCGGFDFG